MTAEAYLFVVGFGFMRLFRKRRSNGVDKVGQEE